jgi:hypothetical protein
MIVAILNILWIIGIYKVTDQGMILGGGASWLTEKLPHWVTKPLFNCVYCMSSVHGLAFFPFTGLSWYFFPVYVVCIVGALTIIVPYAQID